MKQKYTTSKHYEAGLGIVGGLTIAFVLVLFLRTVSPLIIGRAEAKLQGEFNLICAEAVEECLNCEELSPKDIVTVERGSGGEISVAYTDVTQVNRIKAYIAKNVQKKLDDMDRVTAKVNIGGFFGFKSDFSVPVRVASVNVLKMDLKTDFEAAGVNQTKLGINMTFQTDGKLIFAGEVRRITVKTEVPVVQTVLVGDVPNTYVNVNR